MPHEALSTRPQAAELAIHGGPPVSADTIGIVSVALEDEDVEAAVSVLRSRMLAQGPRVAEFEKRFAAMTGARHAIACANGTCALKLPYDALLKRGDDVLVPAWGYIATASMLVASGARPVFCDADPTTYCIDLDDAARRLTKQTTAIAATHLYGNPVDIDRVEAFAIENGLSVVYDAAQAHLATYKGRGLGEYGDAVTYSFYPTKNMTTGEGGMVTTNDDALASRIRALRSHGEAQKYVHDSIGYNYRMTDVEAAMGVSQLKRLPDLTTRRRLNAAAFDQALSGIEGLHAPVVTEGGEHAYHLYAVRLDLDKFVCARDEFCEALKAEGVATAIHYPRPLTRQPVFEALAGDAPVGDDLAQRLFCIPVHPALTEQQVAAICDALRKVADAYRR